MARHKIIVVLVLLGFASTFADSTALGQSTTPVCTVGYTVYFANGIWNNVDQAVDGMYATQNLIGPTFNSLPIHYAVRFHDENTVGNVTTVLWQKLLTDPSFAWANGSILTELVLDAVNGLPYPSSIQQFLPQPLQIQLANMVASAYGQAIGANGIPGNGYYDSQVGNDVQVYLQAMQQGQLVLVVAHSQGNLYVDAAARQLFANGSNSNLQSAFAVESVATPDVGAVSNINGTAAYITSSNDLVIGGLQAVFPAVLNPTDGNHVFDLTAAAACRLSESLPDCTGHQFLLTYLNPDLPFRSGIQSQASALLGQLAAANAGASCIVAALQIAPQSPTVPVGSTQAFSVSATNASGKPVAVPPNLSWLSSDDNIASVVGGVVTGIAQGSVTITVTDVVSGAKAVTSVTVTAVANAILTASFTYQPTGGGDSAGGEGHFTLDLTQNTVTEFDFVNASNNPQHPGTFTYALSDLGYLTYNQQTKLLNLSTYAVSATDPIYFPQIFSVSGSSGFNQGMTATQDFPTVPQSSGPVTVAVSGALQLHILPGTLTVSAGTMTTVGVGATLSGQPVNAPTNLQWSSSNSTIASVNASVVSGVSVGAAVVTITDPNSGATDSAEVTVVSPWAGTWNGSIASTCSEYEYTGPWSETITSNGGNSITLTATVPSGGATIYTVSGNSATPVVASQYPNVYTLSGNTITAYSGLNGCLTGTLTRQQ